MELINSTGMAAAYAQGLLPDGRETLVVVVKGTFTLPVDGSVARLAKVQRPLLMADLYAGTPGLSAMLREMDFAPFKPFCDVLVSGNAWAPDGRPASKITAGIRVGRVSKAFAVLGPRLWEPGAFGVAAGLPGQFVEQPISYAHAFGGTLPVADHPGQSHTYLSNPVGCGWYPRQVATADILGMPMPTTEELAQPITSPNGDYPPMALGPIARNIYSRSVFAGTYDDAWLRDNFPYLPNDFDVRNYQAAPLDQQTDYLQGGEDVLLLNLTRTERAGFQVPRVAVPVSFFLRKGGYHTLQPVIDTLAMDTDAGTVEITWRVNQPLSRNLFEIAQVVVGTQTAGWWRRRDSGKRHYTSLAAVVAARRNGEGPT